MSAKVLGGAVDHQVHTVPQRAQVDRSSERAVDGGDDAAGCRDLRKTAQVRHTQVRIGRRLEKDHPSARADR